jgi:hypothetical protein
MSESVVLTVICAAFLVSDGARAAVPGDALNGRLSEETADAPAMLERLREGGDLAGQRRHAWAVAARLFATTDQQTIPAFESWHGEGEVFATAPPQQPQRGILGFSRASEIRETRTSKHTPVPTFPDVPVFAYTLYNPVAYEHIRAHRLNRISELDRLRHSGRADAEFTSDRAIPPFPPQAVVLKTMWWPVAKAGVTTLPVWDPADNPPRSSGNSYLQWQRSVIVDPSIDSAEASVARSEQSADRTLQEGGRFGLTAFYHLQVDARFAARANRDNEAGRASLAALGRPLQAGDYLVLVGVNFATKEIENWVWGTLWWHDRADQGPFAADRPAALPSVLQRYLMQVAFDSEKPLEPSGGSHICFNPWLEARFPDGGHGGGVVSNCLTCHRRASYPPVNFLPVTRGAADRASDPAYAPGRLRTGFLWSIALHATP